MNENTKEFLNLILEKEEKPKEEKEESKKEEPRERSYTVFVGETDNTLSKGRPLGDAGSANMRYRAYGTPQDAKSVMDDLKLKKPTGSKWVDLVSGLLSSARAGDLRVLIRSARIVQSKSGSQQGVKLELAKIWKDDDKEGKRSFGFIKAIIIGANRAGFLNINSTIIKNLRIEEIVGEDAFLIYVSKKAKSWGK